MNQHLKIICDYILKKEKFSIIDIGTDHGILPIQLVENNYQGLIFATDIRKNIIKELKIKTFIYKNINCLLNDGLKNISNRFDVIVIAGLGPRTMIKILKEKHLKPKEYIFQSIKNLEIIRSWIQKNKLFIKMEKIIYEKKYYYQTIFVSSEEGIKIKNEKEIIFGPFLLKEKSKHFYDLWKKELQKLHEINNKIKYNNDKKKQIIEKISLINEVLKENEN